MRLLLDTHIFIWLATNQNKIEASVLSALLGNEHHLLLSVASVWEMQIKFNRGKLNIGAPVEDFTRTYRDIFQVETLLIIEEQVWSLASLPLHHRDPFDRLLIAQALADELTIVTADAQFAAYNVSLFESEPPSEAA